MNAINFNNSNIPSLANTTPDSDASFEYDAFNRLTHATYPEKVYDYAYDPFGNMLTAQENGLTVFSKAYTAANRISGYSYDARGNLTHDGSFAQVWDKRNRMTESRKATNALLGSYVYNERGLRVKAERYAQPSVQVVRPNGGESLYLGALDTISWNGLGLAGGQVKLELLVGGAVAGTIAENLPGTQTSFQWQVGKTLTGTVNLGSDYKIRVTAEAPPAASGTTYYFYDSGGKLLSEYDRTGACVKDYLYLGGKMIGEYVPATSSYYYYASDQINSTRMVTDATGAVVHSAQYDPYGGLHKTWVDTFHHKPGFSGKEREFGSEMDYFGARYYGHRLYRFITVDPILNKEETITNPQLWNQYIYCLNNPISLFDPDGRDVLKDISKWWGGTPLKHFLTGDTAGGMKILGENLQVALSDPSFVLGISGGLKIKKGISVLGKHPHYLNLADELGARRFSIPKAIWEKMSLDERWTANKKFLDRMIARGDDIIYLIQFKT